MSSKFLNSTLYMYVLIIKVQFGFYIAYSTCILFFLGVGGGGGLLLFTNLDAYFIREGA